MKNRAISKNSMKT